MSDVNEQLDHLFRTNAHDVVEWIAQYLANIEELPIYPSDVSPGDIKNSLPKRAPLKAEPFDSILEDFKKMIVPGMTHWQHPGWFAYFPANSSPPSVLAEFLVAAMGAQCMSWNTSPAATELEEVVMVWLRQMLNLPSNWSGVIQDTASTGTLCALVCAREWKSGFAVNTSGFTQSNMRIYVTAHTHSSIVKGARIAGFGESNVVQIPSDECYAMQPDALERQIREDLHEGLLPTCVVATIGTTSTTAVDPVPSIAAITRKYKLWLHVDAAFVGSVTCLPEYNWLLDGLQYVDSYIMNPHKWLMTNFDCSAFFIKNPSILTQSFSITPHYLKTSQDELVNNYRDWGIQLGRRFRALKLWFVLRAYGVEGIRQVLRRHLMLAKEFAEYIEKIEGFEIVAPVRFSLVCFRYRFTDDELLNNALNRNLLDKINSKGNCYLTHAQVDSKFVLRLAVGQRNTKRKHIQTVIKHLLDCKEEVIQGR